MIHKLKKLKLLLTISLAGLLFCCNIEDEVIKQHSHDQNVKMTKVPLSELLLQEKFSSAYKKIPKRKVVKHDLAGRSTIEEQFGFTIIDAPVNVIEKDGQTYYNILVVSDNNIDNKIENIVLTSTSNQENQVHLVKYNALNTTSSINQVFDQGIKEIIDLNTQTTIEANRCQTIVYELYYCADRNGPQDCGGRDGQYGCYQYTVSISFGCGGSNTPGGSGISTGTGGTGTGGTGGTSSGSSGSSGTGTSVITSPVICNGCPSLNQLHEEPCSKLKDLYDPAKGNIKQAIVDNLRPNIAINPSGEKAAYIQKLPDGTIGTTISNATSDNQVRIRKGLNYFAAIHTHPLDTQPMFSFSDVYQLYQMNLNLAPHNQGLATFMLVCQDDDGVFQTYAIVLNENAMNTIENLLNSPENEGCAHKEIIDNMDEKFENEYAKEDAGANNYERAFLRKMFGYDVSLYKADQNLTNWSKLEINRFTGNIENKPCN